MNKAMWKNTEEKFGLMSKLFHWLSAITVFLMFGLGFWMVDLTYYSQWYKTAPHWHESAGVLLFIVTILRLIWRLISTQPEAIASHSLPAKQASKIAHFALYLLLFVLMTSGFLMSSADGKPRRSCRFNSPIYGLFFNCVVFVTWRCSSQAPSG